MDGRSECRNDRNCDDNCEDFQSDMGTSPVAPVEIVVHDNTSRGRNQRSRGKPVPPGLDRVFRPDFAFDAGHFRNGDCRNMLRRACQMRRAPAT
jgi:hypothetical protein